MMKYIKFSFLLIAAALATISCSNDDDGTVNVPVRDRDEVQQESDSILSQYLQTHFYNYEEFENPTENFDYKVDLGIITGENADKTPLSEFVETLTFNIEDVDYKLYRLNVREGAGNRATFADSVYLNYEGQRIDGGVFDRATTPVWFNLPGSLVVQNTRPTISGNTVFGFANGIDGMRGASQVNLNDDGTLDFNNDYGISVLFIPAGLGYFNSASASIPAYSNLIFKIYLRDAVENTDGDGDGVPNNVEDINGNNTVLDDDTDENNVQNFVDTDDDGDFVPTREEIVINADGSITYLDTDGDGIPNYLDADDDGDGIPTAEEVIINVDGSITYPDENNNGTPDYLDPQS